MTINTAFLVFNKYCRKCHIFVFYQCHAVPPCTQQQHQRSVMLFACSHFTAHMQYGSFITFMETAGSASRSNNETITKWKTMKLSHDLILFFLFVASLHKTVLNHGYINWNFILKYHHAFQIIAQDKLCNRIIVGPFDILKSVIFIVPCAHRDSVWDKALCTHCGCPRVTWFTASII